MKTATPSILITGGYGAVGRMVARELIESQPAKGARLLVAG